MKTIGLIGYGSMGSMLINGFLKTGVIKPEQTIVSTRTKSKIESLHVNWPKLKIADDNSVVVRESDVIFICVKPNDFKPVLEEIKDEMTADKHIVSSVGVVTIASMEKFVEAQISRLMPSLTSEVNAGISLISHGDQVTEDNKDFVNKLLSEISHVKMIDEAEFELATEITSCGPGFIASLFEEMTKSALRANSRFTDEEIEFMVYETIIGTVKYFEEKRQSFSDTVDRVATKGGFTAYGVEVLRDKMPDVFDKMFERAMFRHGELIETINKDF